MMANDLGFVRCRCKHDIGLVFGWNREGVSCVLDGVTV